MAEDLPGDPGDAEDQGSPPGFGAGMSPRRNLPRLSVFTSIPERGRPSSSETTRPDATKVFGRLRSSSTGGLEPERSISTDRGPRRARIRRAAHFPGTAGKKKRPSSARGPYWRVNIGLPPPGSTSTFTSVPAAGFPSG